MLQQYASNCTTRPCFTTPFTAVVTVTTASPPEQMKLPQVCVEDKGVITMVPLIWLGCIDVVTVTCCVGLELSVTVTTSDTAVAPDTALAVRVIFFPASA